MRNMCSSVCCLYVVFTLLHVGKSPGNKKGQKKRKQENTDYFFIHHFRSTHRTAPFLPSTPSAISIPAPSRLQFRFPQRTASSHPTVTQNPKQPAPQKTPALVPPSLHTEGPQQRPASSSPLRPPPAEVLVFHPPASSSPQRKENSSEQTDIRGGARE